MVRVKDVADGLPDLSVNNTRCQHYWINHIFCVQYLSTEETVLLLILISQYDLPD